MSPLKVASHINPFANDAIKMFTPLARQLSDVTGTSVLASGLIVATGKNWFLS